MELKVYDWEFFERGKMWYIIFACVILLVAVLSVLSNNVVWWVIVLLFASGYLYFSLKSNKTTKMIIWKKVLEVWKTIYQWETLKWFVLEYHTKKRKIHNIVIIDNKNDPKIYTINDTAKNIEGFVNELNGYIPMLETYPQSSFDKFVRKLKL
jgi:hypothetical protein